MNELTVADELAYEALPDEVKQIAEKYWKSKIGDPEEHYSEGYDEGYRAAEREAEDCDCEDEYDSGYENGQSDAEEKYETIIEELKERISELEANDNP